MSARTLVALTLTVLVLGARPTRSDDLKDGEVELKDGVVRINKDVDELFPKDVTRVDFDADPAGERFDIGTDISKAFVPVGCTFETSQKDSFVSIEPYNVGGRSGKFCAATHKPLYQGTITIRFCKPKDEKIPATVTTVGFWTSHVAIGGTKLVAYGVDDKEIATVVTDANQRDFLALRSKTPIAYVKVVPDNDIDPDYAIDDLVFDVPQATK